jgi:hypothetical protein
MEGIAEPHDHDVLCGRGGGSNNHRGNEAFRKLVGAVKVEYVACPKREKPIIAMRVVQAVRAQSPPGRFLQHDKLSNTWKDVGDNRAREKTSQALREGAPIIRDLVHKPSPSTLATVLKDAKKDVKKKEAVNKNDITVSGTPPSSDLSPLPMAVESAINDSSLTFSNHSEMEHRQVPSLSIDSRPTFYHHSLESRRVTARDFPVPFEIVRGILLGHIDPVAAAASLLSREDASMVAQRYQFNARMQSMIFPVAPKRETGNQMDDVTQTVSIDSHPLTRAASSSSCDKTPVSSPKRSPTNPRRTPLKKRKVVVDV